MKLALQPCREPPLDSKPPTDASRETNNAESREEERPFWKKRVKGRSTVYWGSSVVCLQFPAHSFIYISTHTHTHTCSQTHLHSHGHMWTCTQRNQVQMGLMHGRWCWHQAMPATLFRHDVDPMSPCPRWYKSGYHTSALAAEIDCLRDAIW